MCQFNNGTSNTCNLQLIVHNMWILCEFMVINLNRGCSAEMAICNVWIGNYSLEMLYCRDIVYEQKAWRIAAINLGFWSSTSSDFLPVGPDVKMSLMYLTIWGVEFGNWNWQGITMEPCSDADTKTCKLSLNLR